MGWAMLSKSSIHFSVDRQGCVPSLLFDLRRNYGGGSEDNGYLLQKVPCMYCYIQCPQPCREPPPTHTSTGDSWTLMGNSGSVSCGATAPSSWVLVHTGFVCALQESVSPVLCKFWQLYGGVNGDLLQEDLCHTRVYCTHNPCSSILLTHTYAGDTQTQLCLSFCGVSGSWCAQDLFEPSEHVWQVYDLILYVISPFLLSFWGFSFALGCGVRAKVIKLLEKIEVDIFAFCLDNRFLDMTLES